MAINVAFDFRTDTRPGKDPDYDSRTLRRYHRLLWSKPLPSGAPFELSNSDPRIYLRHQSTLLGDFQLASDAVMQTFTRWPKLKPITTQCSEADNDEFMRKAYTIGAMMVFPGNEVEGKQTINVARGFNPSIADRFDLTLECIRRHYLNQGGKNPLGDVLSRYREFFALFGDFSGYVSFFLLEDLLDEDGSVKFFMPFDDFRPPSVPKDVATYKEFRRRSLEFIESRNQRILRLNL